MPAFLFLLSPGTFQYASYNEVISSHKAAAAAAADDDDTYAQHIYNCK
jgi:hypothetical protein